MFRIFVNISLIIYLAVADVAAQYDKASIKKIAGAAPVRRLAISAGSGGDELSKPDILSSLLSKLFGLPSNFFSPTTFLAKANVADDFNLATCRLTLDFSKLQGNSLVDIDLIGQTVYTQVTSSGFTSKRNSDGINPFVKVASQTILKHVIPDSCEVRSEKVVAEFKQTTKVLTISFPRAAPTSTDDASNSFPFGDGAKPSPSSDAESDSESADDNDEPMPNDDATEPTPSDDTTEPEEGEGVDDQIEIKFKNHPISIIKLL